MSEHPIIFNAEMVSRKTQTRRIIRPSIPAEYSLKGLNEVFTSLGKKATFTFERAKDPGFIQLECPYGKVGDRLWVRETLLLKREGDTSFFDILYKSDNTHCETSIEVHGDADDWCMSYCDWHAQGKESQVIPSIHMPKWAARIWLEITAIRVERVQDISEDDAEAEGMNGVEAIDTIPEFAYLWDSINAKPKPIMKNGKLAKVLLGSEALNRIAGNIACYVSYPWEDIQEVRTHRGKKWFVRGNPFVWVIEFRRAK